MLNIYYTAREGKRNRNGHTTTRGEVYKITRGDNTTPHGEDALELNLQYWPSARRRELTQTAAIMEKARSDTARP